jgi:hypothetical protein
MRVLTQREKKTIRYGALGIAAYLALFCGVQVWKFFEKQRTEYGRLLQTARELKREVEVHETRALTVQKLMEGFQIDPAKLCSTTVVAQASAAIQKAALSSGIQLGPIRESPARPSSREIGSMQVEGTGPVPAITALLSRLETVGFPLVIESAQMAPAMGKQGQLKLNLTILILDFEQWRKPEVPHA